MLRQQRRLFRALKRPFIYLAGLTSLLYFFGFFNVFTKSQGDLKAELPVSQTQTSSPWKNLPQVKTDTGNASAVIEMTRFAWRGYIHLCALRQNGNELAPVTNSCSPLNDAVIGRNNLMTVIDSLDTLALMGLADELKQGRELTETMFDPLVKNGHVSVFETTIRVLGGLLGAFSFTEDPKLFRLAGQVADGLSAALDDGKFPTHVTMKSKHQRTEPGEQGKFSMSETNAADVGSLYLEFAYLADLLNDESLLTRVERYQKAIMNLRTKDGLVPLFLVVKSPWKLEGADGSSYAIGSRGDSYYEYLVKRCLFDLPAQSDCISTFTQALDGIIKHLTVVTPNNHVCSVELKPNEPKVCLMEHLSCFAGGMFALAYLQDRNRADWLEFAERITETCYLSYVHSPTGLGSEIFGFNKTTLRFFGTVDKYILRPETVESLYYLYRVTGKQMYRDWGWNIMKALNSRARTSSGYSGLEKMNGNVTYDNTQWSFFLAETLKYLYLLFTSSETLPMDQWVFNTEAHVFPSNRNPLRWKHKTRGQNIGILQRLRHMAISFKD